MTDDAVAESDGDEDQSIHKSGYSGVLQAFMSLVVSKAAGSEGQISEGLHETTHDHRHQEDVQVHWPEDTHQYLSEQLNEVPPALVIHDLERVQHEAEVNKPHEVSQMADQGIALDSTYCLEEIDQEEDEIDGRQSDCSPQESLRLGHKGIAFQQYQPVVDAEVIEQQEDYADNPVEEDKITRPSPNLELRQVAAAGLQG